MSYHHNALKYPI